MKRKFGIGLGLAAVCAIVIVGPVSAQTSAPSSGASDSALMVPAAGPGVFKVTKGKAAGQFHLVVSGHKLTSRSDIEKYLAWRAAQLTMERKGSWFTLVEARGKGETADPTPKPDPGAPRHSFQMKYFRPVWRYKTAGAADWVRWSPFSGQAFAADPKSVEQFEVSADITVRKGVMDDANPLAFEAGALSDLLANQVSPPV